MAWHVAAEKLQADIRLAATDREGAELRRQALAAARDELAKAEAAEPARAAIEAIDAADEQATRAARATVEMVGLAQTKEAEALQAKGLAEQAAALHADREAARNAAMPEVQAARAADVRLAEAREQAAAAGIVAKGAADVATLAANAVAEHEAAIVAADRSILAADAWLSERTTTEPIATAWGELQVHLGVVEAESARRATATAAAPALRDEAARAASA